MFLQAAVESNSSRFEIPPDTRVTSLLNINISKHFSVTIEA